MQKPSSLLSLLVIGLALIGCEKAPDGIHAGATGFEQVTRYPWSDMDTVNVTSLAAPNGRGGLSIDQPGAAERAWLREQGCEHAFDKLDEGMTETLTSMPDSIRLKTTDGAPVVMARRVYVCP
jgi:hypothetical protein